MVKHEIPRKLLFLIGVTFLITMTGNVFVPILTLYMREVGVTIVEVGLMLAVPSIVGMTLRIPFGLAADRYGRKTIILIAIVVQFLSTVLLYLVPAPVWFYPILALRAIPMAAYWSQAVALASDMAPEGRRGEVIGQYFLAFGVGWFLGPLLCSFLTGFMNYGSILLVTLIFPPIGIALFLRGGLGERNRKSFERSEGGGILSLNSFKRILNSKNIRALCINKFFWGFNMAIFSTLFSIYAQESLFISSSLISLLFVARGGVNASIRLPMGRISDKIGRKKPLILAYTLNFLAYFTVSLTGSYPLLVLAMAAFGIGWGTIAVVSNTLITENANPEDGGLVLSITQTVASVGQLLGSVFAGMITIAIATSGIFKLSSFLFLIPVLSLILFVRES